jgi:hypothetical protein
MGGHANPHAPEPVVSVVIVAYDMHRELPRTVRSLSPDIQVGIDAGDYELIVFDNGSQPPIAAESCNVGGAPLHWRRFERASPSPVSAMNVGIREARAPLVGAMIDGARMVSPGLLRAAVDAARIHPRAIVATHGFHLGPEAQQQSVPRGYNAAQEDRLLSNSEWTRDGYRLFGVSVPAGSSQRGWFAPPNESTAIFMSAELWGELGGYDEAFVSPGGGLANADLFARACALSDTRLIVLLGEATFHQIHGGTTTSKPGGASAAARVEYERLRGRPWRLPPVAPLFVGNLSPHVLPSIAAAASAAASAPPDGIAAARRYIDLLKRCLLGEVAEEAEAAFLFSLDSADRGQTVPSTTSADVAGIAPGQLEEVREARREGRYVRDGELGFAYTMIGRARLDNLDQCVTSALFERVEGDLVECGVWRGGAAMLMRGVLVANGVTDRKVWVCDSFAGLPKSKATQDTLDLSADVRPELAVSQQKVAENFRSFDLLDEQVRFLVGFFKDSLPGAPIDKIAVLRLDGDLYESTMTSLTALYERVSPGGFVIVDDYGAMPPCRAAVTQFRAERGITDPLVEIDWTGVYWRKGA